MQLGLTLWITTTRFFFQGVVARGKDGNIAKGLVTIFNSQHGQSCGYLNAETGTMSRQSRSFYKPEKSTKFAKNLKFKQKNVLES